MIGGITKRAPAAARPRFRRTFSGTLSVALVLTVARGCHQRNTDKLGDVISDSRDAQRYLRANIGDRLLLASVDDASAYAWIEITAVEPSGWTESYRARWFGYGELPPGTVWVIPCAWARASSAPKRQKGRAA